MFKILVVEDDKDLNQSFRILYLAVMCCKCLYYTL